jgi:hypothetical protein
MVLRMLTIAVLVVGSSIAAPVPTDKAVAEKAPAAEPRSASVLRALATFSRVKSAAFSKVKGAALLQAKNRRRAQPSDWVSSYTATDMTNMLRAIFSDPNAIEAMDMLAHDERIWGLAAALFDDEWADSLQQFGEVDMMEEIDQLDMLLAVMGDMDMTEVKAALESMYDTGDSSAMMDLASSADFSAFASADVDMDAMTDMLDSIDLDALLYGDLDLSSDPTLSQQSGTQQLMELQTDMQAKLDADPQLDQFIHSTAEHYEAIVESHKNDNDNGEALQAELQAFNEQAIEEYMSLDSVSEEDREAITEGMEALNEVYVLFESAVDNNVDKAEIQRLYQAYQLSQGGGWTSTYDDCWFRCEPSKSAAEKAVDELIPDPPFMTPWQSKMFQEIKASYVIKYEAHPDWSTMSEADKQHWEYNLLQDCQKELATVISSQQLKQWAAVAYAGMPSGR